MGYDGSIPFTYASIIAPVPGLIADLGGKIGRPFRESGVPIELTSEPERIITVHDYLTLLEASAREAGDEQFGVSLGDSFDIDNLGPFGRLISGASTLRRAIATDNDLIKYYSTASRSWLGVEGEMAYWHYQLAGARDCREGRRIDGEYRLLLYRNIVRLAAGPKWQPKEILLAEATPTQLRTFQSRLRVAACWVDTYALVFPRDLLDLPMTYAKPLGETDRQVLLTRLMSTRPDDTFIGLVKAIVRSHLIGGHPEISAVARSTGLSLRTLQRRLAEEGLTYWDLVADVRSELAQELLADPSCNQIDISLSLGYSDAANFNRAFKQWTGVSPSQFRRLLVESPPNHLDSNRLI